MSNPYESPQSMEMGAPNALTEATTQPTIFFAGGLCVVAAFCNQVATFWGCIDPSFRTNGRLVASFLFGAAIVAIFAFGVGAFCGWIAPARRTISLPVAVISLLPIVLPAVGLFAFYSNSYVHYDGYFIALHFTAVVQGIGLCIVSMRYLRRWAVIPIGGAACALGSGLVGLWYYMMIISGV
jgi:uncharacterized membrane protein